MRKLFMVINEDRFFLSHRKEIALQARQKGWDVTIVAKNTGCRGTIETLGLSFIDLPIEPTGMNPMQELKTFRFLLQLYKRHPEAIVHHVGLKNILWGSLAGRLSRIKGVVNAVSGLGTLFSNEKSALARMLMVLLGFGHRRSNLKVIFQNHDDENLFDRHHVVASEQKVFIKGSGVDLNDYRYVPEPDADKLKIIFTGRMLKEKGVLNVVEAAELLRNKYQEKVVFWLCGGLSDNPKALTRDEINAYCDGQYIRWLGFRTDVKELLALSAIVAFPSYYREGVPKSLIEAAAVGRPIVTTDSVGCRDTVDDGTNGFLIPVQDSRALAEKLEMLIVDPQLRQRMGMESRRMAERDFSLTHVVRKHMEIYESLDAVRS